MKSNLIKFETKNKEKIIILIFYATKFLKSLSEKQIILKAN